MKKRKLDDDDKENNPPQQIVPLHKKKKFGQNIIIPPPVPREFECGSPSLPMSPGTPCSPSDQIFEKYQMLYLPTMKEKKTNPDCNTISSETVRLPHFFYNKLSPTF